MQRFRPIDFDTLTDEQKRLFREIAGPRGGVVSGPFAVWLRANPMLADTLNRAGNTLRVTGRLDKRLFEIAVLCVARAWTSPYEWAVHAAAAEQQLGISPQVIAAIRQRRAPRFEQASEQLVHDAVVELNDTRQLSDSKFQQLHELLGFDVLVELVTTVGFYSMVAIVLNSFRVPPPLGAEPIS